MYSLIAFNFMILLYAVSIYVIFRGVKLLWKLIGKLFSKIEDKIT